MSSNDNLGEIVKATRSELGYEVYESRSFWSDIQGEFYWLFRNMIKKPVIPANDEGHVTGTAAMVTKTHDNIDLELLEKGEYSLMQLLPHALETFPKVFRAGMKAYLEQRHYVTKPQQVWNYIAKPMCESLTPSQIAQ